MFKFNFSSQLIKETVYLSRYAGSGLVNTIVGFAVIFFAMLAGISPIISNVAGYAVGFVLGFILSKKFVFRSSGHFVSESIRYLAAFIISFLFNLLVLSYCINVLKFLPVVAQVTAAISYTLLMYILTRLLVFNSTIKR